ncbi:hypothetical protein GDO86_012255 [Hymenochirus boettgeri]|uniref:GB1/RHD3-type G domain-containing protein n=1 Tax=Hymenochirus boettgeri TaxID=247094 RepID=A0A8T2IPY0_9PIPI|nr:hypothetical protein GDO86_012255 [Hymenochirus boettgeri]
MQHPVCLIENQEGNKLTINQEAAQILQNITNPVVVVAIVGKYRTGKSYLMNKLAGSNDVLGNLTVTYVESIRSGSIPCMENAVLALSQIENTTAIHEAVCFYEEKMNQMQAENMAVKTFMDRSFKDDKRQYQAQLMKILQELFVKFKQHNEEASIKKCRELIRVLSVNLEEGGMENNEGFCKPGGHRLFLEEKQRLIDSYNNTPRKGIKATEVLQDFMESKKITEAAILQADKSLTQREKEIEEARIQREAEEQKHQLEMEKLKQEEKLREEQVRSFEQQAIMLKEKMEQERLQMLKENEWMIEEKLREKEKVKDHPHKVNMLDEQVQDLRNQNEQTSGNDWIIHGIGALAEVAALALPGVFGKVANIAASFIRKIF